MPGTARVISVRQNDLTARARAAADAAKVNAAAVDVEARFPSEAFAEIRRQRLLGIQVPSALGGEGASIAEIADVCYILGQACSSTALIYAMHQIKMACITRHAKGNAVLERILGRIAAEQLLMASSTTEGQAGGNVRSSEAAVEHDGEQVTLERKATVISYAVEADGVVTTARRAADAAGSDQVLLVLLKADYTLERLQAWDTLGMRGTHSEGFTLRARAAAEQISKPGTLRKNSRANHGALRPPFVGFRVGGDCRGRRGEGAGLHSHGGPQRKRTNAAGRRAFHPGGLVAADFARRAGGQPMRSYEGTTCRMKRRSRRSNFRP